MEQFVQQIIEFLNAIIKSADPNLRYILYGSVILIALFFIRRLLQLMMLVVGAIVAYYIWCHFSGQEVALKLPRDLSVDSIVYFVSSIVDDIKGLFGNFMPDNLDDAKEAVELVTE